MDVAAFMFLALVLVPGLIIAGLVALALKTRQWGFVAIAVALSIFPIGYLTFAYLIWFMPGH